MIDDDFDKLLKKLHEVILEDISADSVTTIKLYRNKEGVIIDAVLYIKDNNSGYHSDYYFTRMNDSINKSNLKKLMIKVGRPAIAYDDSTPLWGNKRNEAEHSVSK